MLNRFCSSRREVTPKTLLRFVLVPTHYPSLPSPTSGLQPPRWSPLGIDLGLPDETADARSTRSRDPTSAIIPEDTKNRAEELKQAVEAITSQTLLMELSLDGQLFQYLSSAWQDLVGYAL